MASEPDKAKELQLINKLEFRIALERNDEKLQTMLGSYLAPLLLKLKSPHQEVQQKTVEVCQHLQTRIETSDIQLPILALLEQLKNHGDSRLLRVLNARFLRLGLPRISAEQRERILIDGVLKGISKHLIDERDSATLSRLASSTEGWSERVSPVGSYLLHFLFYLIIDYKFPRPGDKANETFRSFLGIEDLDGYVMSKWFSKLLLLPMSFGTAAEHSNSSPGLSRDDIECLMIPELQNSWKPNNHLGLTLAKVKTRVLDFAETGAFTEAERQWVFLFAIPETCPISVLERGNTYFKAGGTRLHNQEDSSAIQRLYDVYLEDSPGSSPTASIPITLRMRVLQLLTGPKLALSKENMSKAATILASGIEKTDSGLPSQRFNTAFLGFCTWVFRSSELFKDTVDEALPPTVNLTAQNLVEEMKTYLITNQGWPTPEGGVDLALRGKLYQVIGVAAQEGNLRDIGLLKFLFQSLNEDRSGGDVLQYVEDALSAMTLSFSKHSLSEDDQEMLEEFLLQAIQSRNVHKSHFYRLARFANRCLPYRNEVARFIDVLVAGSQDISFEAAEEGRNGLNPYLFKMENIRRPDLWSDSVNMLGTGMELDAVTFAFPKFNRIIQTFFLESSERNFADTKHLSQEIEKKSAESLTTFTMMIKYAYRIFITQALGSKDSPPIDANWETATDLLVSNDTTRRKVLQNSLQDAGWTKKSSSLPLLTLLIASLQAFSMEKGANVEDCQGIFVQILCTLPSELFETVAEGVSITHIIQALRKHSPTTRDLAARAFGILFAIGKSEYDNERLKELVSWTDERGSVSSRDKASGAILGLSHALCRLHATNQSKRLSQFPHENLNSTILSLLSESNDKTLLDTIFVAIGQMAIWNVYGNVIEVPFTEQPDTMTAQDIATKIHKKAKSGEEKAITALGRFSVWSDNDVFLKQIYDYLYSCHEIRQTEAQFAVGEAICCVMFGSKNTALEVEFDLVGPPEAALKREELANDILEKTLSGCKQSKPSLRRASLIWLLSLVRFGGDNELITSQLEKCHQAFKASLGHRDELVQEAAARGLGIVYERANKELKEDLVRDLLSSFSSRQGNLAGMVSADTELFEDGALGSGEGTVSTYKQILDLANEAGNPSLVYQFMSLAADNEVWTSRAAFGKFGLSSIFADSGVEEFLAENPKLLPALYRYQFDPSPTVQEYMRTLWKALIKDPNATLDLNYDHIMTQLLKAMEQLRWRDIEASYLAIGSLIQGRKFEKYEKFVREIWQKTARGLDHIKASVRVAAGKLAQILTNVLVRSVESDDGIKQAREMADHVIPFLLSQAAPTSNPESREFAASTIIKLGKKSRGEAIEKYVPELIQTMIRLFTDMEPGVVNWMHLNASKLKLSTKDLDEIRLNSGVKNSPLMEAIEKLIDNNYKNPQTIEEIVKVLESSARTSIGMPSLAASSRILVVMMVRYQARYKQYADGFLRVIRKPLFDRNDAVCSSFAYAAGYIARYASDKSLLEYLDWVWGHWRDNSSDRDRAVAAEVFLTTSKYAPERCANLAEKILPYIFIGKHDSQEDVKESFTSAWSESAGGQRATLLHMDAIIKLAMSLLDHQRWSVKHAAARSVAEAAKAVVSLDDMAASAEAPKVWPALVAALSGKSWEGKEVVLQAFVAFVEKVKGFWKGDAKIASEINKVRLIHCTDSIS
jgi:proteasome component ECM29